MTGQEVEDPVEEAFAIDEADKHTTTLAPIDKNTPEKKHLAFQNRLYNKDEIIEAQFKEIAYYKNLTRELDAKYSQARSELSRMHDILDGLQRDKHKYQHDLKKQVRNETNQIVTSLFGGQRPQVMNVLLIAIVVIGVLAVLVLLQNPNFMDGLHSIQASPSTELFIALLVIVPLMFILWLRRRR
ncbi:MAG: hypothetical protein KGH64_06270 [Candidatus Micrarchaeota archaeon]|nr:hypothetical protein [Candidatus Micrarchaeota archaeon]